MADWHPGCYQRATAYVTEPAGRLLLFDHVDWPAAGTEVPAWGIHRGESAEEAVLRELAEGSGIDSAVLVRKLGEQGQRATSRFRQRFLHYGEQVDVALRSEVGARSE